MRITFAPRGILQIDDATVIFKNFEGRGSMYNREGDRNFAIIIETEEMANALIEEGWNVKIKPPREEGENPFMYLVVKIKFNDRGPNIHLKSGRATRRLNESTIGMLDRIDILAADLDIRPYDWETAGKTGRTAYLQTIRVTQRINDRFAEEEYPEE